MPENKIFNLDSTKNQIDNFIEDMIEIMGSKQYNAPIVLKKNFTENSKNRDYLSTGYKIWFGTEEEFNNIQNKDNNTIYYTNNVISFN